MAHWTVNGEGGGIGASSHLQSCLLPPLYLGSGAAAPQAFPPHVHPWLLPARPPPGHRHSRHGIGPAHPEHCVWEAGGHGGRSPSGLAASGHTKCGTLPRVPRACWHKGCSALGVAHLLRVGEGACGRGRCLLDLLPRAWGTACPSSHREKGNPTEKGNPPTSRKCKCKVPLLSRRRPGLWGLHPPPWENPIGQPMSGGPLSSNFPESGLALWVWSWHSLKTGNKIQWGTLVIRAPVNYSNSCLYNWHCTIET